MKNRKNSENESSQKKYFCEICGKPGYWSGWELHGPQKLCRWHDFLQFTDTFTYFVLAFFITILIIILPFIGNSIKVALIIFIALGWKNPWRFLR